jgi:uncharacterized protein with HEPN domain
MPPEDRIRVLHMIEAARTAQTFIIGRRRDDLDSDRMLLFALIRSVEVLGEAASKITLETRISNPAIPWKLIIAMRNRLIHAYFDIDRNVVWKTVTEELPPLLALLNTILPEEMSPEE